MATKLIKLEDGTLVEVVALENEVEQISGGFARQVDKTFDNIRPLLIKTCRPIMAAWDELNQDMHIERAEIELGLSFEGEGNIYVTKATASANLVVKLSLKPKE